MWIDEQDRVRIINTNKSPAALRQQLATALDLPEAQIVIDTTFIGGDFGGKGLSIDEFTCYFLARATGRPIKAVMTYVDELQASNSRHPAIMKLRTAVSRGRQVPGPPVRGGDRRRRLRGGQGGAEPGRARAQHADARTTCR